MCFNFRSFYSTLESHSYLCVCMILVGKHNQLPDLVGVFFSVTKIILDGASRRPKKLSLVDQNWRSGSIRANKIQGRPLGCIQ